MDRKNSNIGTTLMVLQQKISHEKKLSAIYHNKNDHGGFTINEAIKYRPASGIYTKKQQYADQQHIKNIRRLFNNLNREKNYSDRLKDPHDFISYPSLFFREEGEEKKKISKVKKSVIKRVKSQNEFSRKSTKISLEKVRQFLPYLTTFQTEDLQEFADGLNKLIITFNITNRQELVNLAEKVMKILPQGCPKTFRHTVQMMLMEIGDELQK